MIRQLDVKHRTLSRKLNAISGRQMNHAAGGETEEFDVFSIDQTKAINDRLNDHGALFNIERSGKQLKVVTGQTNRIGYMKVYLTIRESGESPNLFMVEDDGGTTKAYDVELTGTYPVLFDNLESENPLNERQYRYITLLAMNEAEYTEPAIGSTYTCLTENPYVTVYTENAWGGR